MNPPKTRVWRVQEGSLVRAICSASHSLFERSFLPIPRLGMGYMNWVFASAMILGPLTLFAFEERATAGWRSISAAPGPRNKLRVDRLARTRLKGGCLCAPC